MASDSRQPELEYVARSQTEEDDVVATAADETIDGAPTEETPLLPPRADDNEAQNNFLQSWATSSKGSSRRWPSLVALLFLIILVVVIILLAFVAPGVVKEYAEQAVVLEPQSLSIDSFTTTGVRARVQASVRMDASRVKKDSVRNLGRFFTYIVREIESGESDLEVSLPEYGNVVLGTAHVPPVKVNIQNKVWNFVDFLTDLEHGDIDGIRSIANDWIDGRLGQLRILGKAHVPLKSGIFDLGGQDVAQELTFASGDIPSIPAYDIQKLNFREIDLPKGKVMAADASITIRNDYPVDFSVPMLGFDILVDNCEESDPAIMVADAFTRVIHVQPKQDIEVSVTGFVRHLPALLIQDCPGSSRSPLDKLLGKYIRGNDTTIYVKGADSASLGTPEWLSSLLSSIKVPLPLPGHSLGHLIKNFSLTDTQFSLPNPWADPDSPDSNPRISAQVKALVALPEEMNFNLSVSRIRADADVFYNDSKFGVLDLHKWQVANSTRLEGKPQKFGKHSDGGPSLLVQSSVENAPLTITDEDVFTSVIERLIFGKEVVMHIKAEVDVGVDTAVGELTVRRIPAEGRIPVKRRS